MPSCRDLRLLLAAAVCTAAVPSAARAQTIERVTGFGSNPGRLDMFEYVPAGVPQSAPLVVLLHSCSQLVTQLPPTGFLELADQIGFYLLLPQQRASNNPLGCFNWAGEYGDPGNLVRGQGENMSIKQMIDRMAADHSIDPARVFIAGFSSGGAFAAVMMATWPEQFAAGAILSGLPYRCADTVQGAGECMRMGENPQRRRTPAEWGQLVRDAAPGHTGPWPRVVLFQGSADATVHTDNLVELGEQWRDVHGLASAPSQTDTVAGHQRDRWTVGGAAALEVWRIDGMDHAVAIGGDPERPCGGDGLYVSDEGLCAAYRAVEFFGLAARGGEADAGPGSDAGPADAGPGDGPTVAFVQPGDGDEVSGQVTIEVEASDDDGVARVEFRLDGMSRGSDAEPPYQHLWQTANYAGSSHTLTAVAYDTLDNPTEASVTVTVAGGAGGDADAGQSGGGEEQQDPERVDPISWGCSAPGGDGGGCGQAAALGLALILAALIRARGGGPDRSRKRRRVADAQQRDGG